MIRERVKTSFFLNFTTEAVLTDSGFYPRIDFERRMKHMGTTIRPELSTKNKYWIDKHRYYELKHFCLQYPSWKKAYATLDGLSKRSIHDIISGKEKKKSDPTEKCVEFKMYYKERINMVEQSAYESDDCLWQYILKGVTEGLSYEILKARLEIPCSKDMYYDRYRKFFYILSKKRA